jgi:predicted GIY-YIG superfamily endonuclease
MENFFYVYVLVNEADATQHYTGITRHLPSRLKEHNQGLRFHKIGTQLQPNRHGRRLSVIMDIDALHSALLSITVVSEKVRAAREILSATGDAPARLGKFLCEAENDLRMAQATLGGELGFSLCPRCWPPELVATDLDGKLTCPVCGRISHEQAA